MSLYSEQSIPHVVTMEGIEGIGLSPEEAFVFTRINGSSTLKEISQILGMDLPRVIESLARLIQLGFVRMDEGKAKAAPLRVKKSGPRSLIEQLDEEDESSEFEKLPRTKRNDIMLRHQALATQTHYEVLGVLPGASADLIKKKYFALVKEFHPDRFFGQSIGHYKHRLEEIFGRVQTAFDALSDAERRAKYDATLTTAKGTGKTEAKGGKGTLGSSTLIEKIATAKRYYEMGQKEEMAGKEMAAANFFQMAYNLMPDDKNIERAWTRMKPVILRRKADEVCARAISAFDIGDFGNAIALMEEAHEMNPRKKECYRYLALLYLRNKATLARAKEMGLKSIELYPQEPEVHATMGQIYKLLGEDKLAQKEFQITLKLDKFNEVAQRGLNDLKGK